MKVAILGTANGWQRAPWDDPTVQKWGINDGYALFGPEKTAQCSAWWELHGDTALTRARRPPNHFDTINALQMPVYYLHGQPQSSKWTRFDIDWLVSKMGRDYFTCTNSYQVAFAMALGATEIGLYGTPLQANREVLVERPCVTYWLGRAEERGIKVIVEHDNPTGLLRHPYRYAEQDIQDRKASFDACYQVFWTMARWIPEEDYRLQQLGAWHEEPEILALR